jgi:ribosome biogenesis ATPase
VLCAKLRLDGTFDFNALAKATPGYVGADLSALAGAAGIIAVKRIFKSFSDGTIVIPDNSAPTIDADTAAMQVDASNSVPVAVISSPPTPSPDARPGELVASSLSITNLPIAHFLHSHPAPLTPAQLAPLCITATDFMLALKEIQPSAQREGFATVPDVTWSDIGALHATRSELHMAVVQPIRRPELFRAVGIDAPAGVLLWGPPGCGKTLLAKAVANESQANFISVKGPELLNKVRRFSRTIPEIELADAWCSMLARVSVRSVRYLRERAPLLHASSSSTSSTHSFQDATKRSPNPPRASSTLSSQN